MRIRAWLSALVASASIALGVPAVAHAAPPPFGYQKEVVASFTDGAGRPVLLRRGWYLGGTGGFGWDKIFHKHGITNMNLVEKIIKNPRGGKQEGTSRVYEGYAQRFRCDISGRCTEVERIPVKAVVEFRNDANLGMGQKGVITAFCNFGPGGPSLCPGWVNTVANVTPA